MRMIKCVPLCVAGLLLLGVLLPVTSTAQTTGPDSRLWYEQPADQWLAALPIGNGRMGGMVFGGVHQEHIQLNEETLWSGGPKETSNPNALQYLPEVRRLINEGKYTVADSVIQHMQGPFTQSYMPLGDLYLDFDAIGEYTDYSRELDIDRAVATTMFTANGVQYKREIIASFPDQVIVIRISADQPGEITFIARLTSLLRHQTSAEGIDQLIMKGRAPSLVEPNYRRDLPNGVRYDEGPLAEGMLFETHITAVNEGGAVSAWDGGLKVSGADAVTLIMSIGTSYNGFDKSPGREGKDPALSARRHLRVAARASWQELLSRHVADYQELYRRG